MPVPPSANALYVNLRFNNGRHVSQGYADFKRMMAAYGFDKRNIIKGIKAKVEGKYLAMNYEYYLRRPTIFTTKNKIKKYDVSNRVKGLEDSIFGLLDADDSQVWILKARKIESPKEYVNCTIWASDNPNEDLAL
jgi:Holliday junction resolvase RusA-like endonuclease